MNKDKVPLIRKNLEERIDRIFPRNKGGQSEFLRQLNEHEFVVSQQNFNKFINEGKTIPGWLTAVAEAVGTTIEQLAGEKPPQTSQYIGTDESMTSVEAAAKFLSHVMEGLRDLPPETRDKAEAMIREALKEEDEVKKMDRSKVGA